jgi:hypothetical protein
MNRLWVHHELLSTSLLAQLVDANQFVHEREAFNLPFMSSLIFRHMEACGGRADLRGNGNPSRRHSHFVLKLRDVFLGGRSSGG